MEQGADIINLPKSNAIKSLLLALVVEGIIVLFNYRLITNLLAPKEEQFSYESSYFFVYHGLFENYPKAAIFLYGVLFFLFLFFAFYFIIWLTRNVIKSKSRA
ncbi:hypothetical protein [Paenibacillus sp. NPDC058071]|uniref:hypothetical protein n=1 Tax=Paenibacillus sp. NPDC058071 TaxID=3346326 RepID=UPI0036DBB158